MRLIPSLAAIAVIALGTPAFAQSAGNPSGWQTWTWQGSCFAVEFPQDAGIAALNSKKAYAAIKHTPKEGISNSISFVAGLADMTGIEGTADVDGKTFSLLLYDGAGFVSSGERENSLLSSMLAGNVLTVTWTGQQSMTVQRYSLSGLSQAKKTIDTACDVH